MAQNAGELPVQNEDWQGLNKQGRRWDGKVKVTPMPAWLCRPTFGEGDEDFALEARNGSRGSKTAQESRDGRACEEQSSPKCTYRLIGGCRSKPQA